MLQQAISQTKNAFENNDEAVCPEKNQKINRWGHRPPGVIDPENEQNGPTEDPEFLAKVESACRVLSPLLTRVAARVARRLPSHVELDDLIGAGAIGLVTAVRQHIAKDEPDLARLAEQRIRGAILDHLRSIDYLTRRQRAAVTAVNKAKQRLANEGETDDINAVAASLGITVQRAEKIQNELASVQVTSFESTDQLRDHAPDPVDTAVGTQMKEHLTAALKSLPTRLQTLLSFYYCENLTYKEIGELLNISRSRICQLHTQAIRELRRNMAGCIQ